jgi:hypothetical protein
MRGHVDRSGVPPADRWGRQAWRQAAHQGIPLVPPMLRRDRIPVSIAPGQRSFTSWSLHHRRVIQESERDRAFRPLAQVKVSEVLSEMELTPVLRRISTAPARRSPPQEQPCPSTGFTIPHSLLAVPYGKP